MQDITDTGVKGFLKWLQMAQPAVYKKVAPQIAAQLPSAFSDYYAGGWRTAGMTQRQALTRQMHGLGDPTVDLSLPAPDVSSVTTPTIDISDAANSGDASTSSTSWIGDLVKGVSSLYLTKQQADIQQQVVNTQLQRAAAGLPPLPASLANLGVPQVNVGLSAGTGGGIAVALGVGGLLLLLSMLKRKRA